MMAAEQQFQYGRMFWFPPDTIFVVQNDFRWESFVDEWDGVALPTTPPDGLVLGPGLSLPARGFGAIWFERELVRSMLGLAMDREVTFASGLFPNDEGITFLDKSGTTVDLLVEKEGLGREPPPDPVPQPPLREVANWHMVILPPGEPRYMINLANFMFVNLLSDGTVRASLLRPISDEVELPDDVSLVREGTTESGRWTFVFTGDSALALWSHICNVAYRPTLTPME